MFSGMVSLPGWGYVLITLLLTHVTIVSVTIFLHRHQAHRALDLGPVPSHFFRFWLWLTTGMTTKEWVAIHRKHHAKCETADDPHSPQIYGLPRVLWTGVMLYVKESRNAQTLERYGHGTPDDWLERKIYAPYHKLGVAIMLATDMAIFGFVPGLLIWIVQVAWIPFWAAGVINGVGHFWGYRNFTCADASTNIFPIGLLIGGEELHNNHHAFAASAKLSNKWYEFDIGWLYIRLLESLGWARVKKVAPRARFGSARTVVDLELLQTVITHRYDVMTRYLHSLHRLAAEEFALLKLEAHESRLLKRLLGKSKAALSVSHQEKLATLLRMSERLAKVYEMRSELEALWARSAVTHEHLIAQLKDWIDRAEQSGIRQLEEFSVRLRCYAT